MEIYSKKQGNLLKLVFEILLIIHLKRKHWVRFNWLRVEIERVAQRPKKVIAPSITSVIKDNEYVSEIFDKYP